MERSVLAVPLLHGQTLPRSARSDLIKHVLQVSWRRRRRESCMTSALFGLCWDIVQSIHGFALSPPAGSPGQLQQHIVDSYQSCEPERGKGPCASRRRTRHATRHRCNPYAAIGGVLIPLYGRVSNFAPYSPLPNKHICR
jgi:hypothetical protein